MTTKKARREMVAAKRAAYDAETLRMGLEAQRREREKRIGQAMDAEKAQKSKAYALKMNKRILSDAASEIEGWSGA